MYRLHPTVASLQEYALSEGIEKSYYAMTNQEKLCLKEEVYGKKILDENCVLMEIKTSQAIPLWLTRVLTKEKIYKVPFSKYGRVYEEIFF